MDSAITELETTLLDQIEKLNQDDVCNASKDELNSLIERSKAMSDLTKNYVELQKVKIDSKRVTIEAVKLACGDGNGYMYEKVLGIEDK